MSNNSVGWLICVQQQIMNNKIKQATQVPRSRLDYCRHLNAKSKLMVFTVHKMIEKMGNNQNSKVSSSQVFTSLTPTTQIHRVSTENQAPQKRQAPMIYTSSKKIETMFRQSSKLRYEPEICPQVEKAIKNIQKRTRQCRTIEGDRLTEFNKNFVHKMKYMARRVKNPQTYSHEALNLMNFGLNIKPIKNIHIKEIKKQKIKMKDIGANQSDKNVFALRISSLNCQTETQSNEIISLQTLNQKNLIIKQMNEPKQNKKMRIKSKLKDQYSSLQKKVSRMFNCLDIILNSFHVRLAEEPRENEQMPGLTREGTNRTFYKNRKNRLKYTYYVGGGNNANLIRSILRKRSWWTQVDNIANARFVWTQLRSEQFIEKMQIANQNWNSQIIFYQEDTQTRQNSSSLKTNFKRSSSTATTDICPLKETSLGYLFHEKHSKKYATVLEPNQAALRLQKIQRPLLLHNHYSQNYMFGNKNALYYNISNFYSFCNKNLANIVPLTFYLQKGNQKTLAQFERTFNDSKYRGSIWIMKPAENSNRGQGIEVTNSLNMIKNKVNTQKKLIVQYYIRNLMLYNNRKFDIRTYIIAMTINGRVKIFWYQEGYIRTSSEIYDADNLADSLIHLTNDAVQKNGENYGLYEIGNKLSYSQFQRYLQTKHQRDGWQINMLHDQMKQLARDAAKAIYCRLNPNNKAFTFQLFGLDFMVDNQFKPYLIQINTNPCLQLSSPVLQRLIPRMMQNMFRLCVDPIFRPEFDFTATKSQSYYIYDQTFLQRNKFSLIFDEKFDRDFEWEQRCKRMRGLQWSTVQQQEFEDEGSFIMVQY